MVRMNRAPDGATLVFILRKLSTLDLVLFDKYRDEVKIVVQRRNSSRLIDQAGCLRIRKYRKNRCRLKASGLLFLFGGRSNQQ
ncbi:hypothetical protein T08_9170 [Trichinella sp. T8]|nr:hypothetical protein T08_9170 [Trichinella sp. T8]